MIDKTSSTPLYLQIQNLIVDQIRVGDYKAGEQVPSELEIASQYIVSRMTARKALDNLVSKGVLFRQHGKGTYVAEDVVSYGLSTMLSFSRTLQAMGYNVVTKVLLVDVIPASSDIVRSLRLGLKSQVIIIRRLRLIDEIHAALHTSYLDYKMFAPIMKFDLAVMSLHDVIHRVAGIQVVYTNDSVQADLATPEEEKQLQLEPNKPILRVEGVAYSGEGQPTRLTRAVYRGDMFRLNVKNASDLATSLKVSDRNE